MSEQRVCTRRSVSCENGTQDTVSLLRTRELHKIYNRLSMPVFPARQTDREEIRRKLAMGSDEDYYGGERAFKKPSLSTRLQGGMNLQICFMNDAAATAGDESEVTLAGTTTMTSSSVMTSSSQSHHNLSSTSTTAVSVATSAFSSLQESSCVSSSSSSSSSSAASQSQTSQSSSKSRPKSDPGLLASQLSLPPSDESIAERQQRLQQEARMALAQASNMARMQLEVERKTKKKSPIADIVGVPELGEGRRVKLSRKLLHEMNLAQLQVLVNDLHSQIESLNEELVHLLMERDDLHMEQDSMLVDIEDLTSFAQHLSETNNNKATQNNRNSSLLNKQLK
ncbi:hypothetical protein ACOMHN_053579 [Nucella lapillus]